MTLQKGSIAIINIHLLVQAENIPRHTPIKGQDMSHLPIVSDAFLIIIDGLIQNFGSMNDYIPMEGLEIIDAAGRMVMPSFVDSHTHIVYAEPRDTEFVDRIKGKTYQEIANAGGGIINSAAKLNLCSEDELFESAKKRLEEVIRLGTGAIEIKSGYGLTIESELKMLRVIKRLKGISPIPVKSTFLGAHAYPNKYKENHQGYIDELKEMILIISRENLADYIDVFCDQGYFSPEETDQILKSGIASGMIPRLHANELASSGGIKVGVGNNAASVDHLEFMSEEEMEMLANSNTIPTLLPGTAFFLGIDYAPARQMIDKGLPIALASDYNPGSSPSGNMSFVLSLACLKLKMLPEEAINAATINTAYSLNMLQMTGSIAQGKLGNVIITKPIQRISQLPYSFGSNLIENHIVNGKIFTSL